MNYRQTDVRQINRKNVLTLIAEKGVISRRDICTLLGSSMTTILKITDYLEDRGLISSAMEENPIRGRRPEVLSLNPEKISILAIDYDGKRVDVAICDYYGRENAYQSYEASNDIVIFFQYALPKIIHGFIRKFHCDKKNILGIGICLPGDFSKDGQFSNPGAPSQFQNSSRFREVFNTFKSEMKMPVFCFNDVNAAAYGEFISRSDPSLKDLVFLYAGDGLGSGLVLDSQLRLGDHDMAGEVGYLSFDSDYITDAKSPGWFESRLSRCSLVSRFPEFAEGEITDGLVDYVARLISIVIANIANILDVRLFIVDGDLISTLYANGLRDKLYYYTSRLSLFNVDIMRPACPHPSLSGLARLVEDECIDDFLKED